MKGNQSQDKNLVVYMSQGQEVKLSPALIRKYLAHNSAVTNQEVLMFLQLCRYRGLNPWLKEAYLVKYGGNPAQIIVGKDAFTTRASQMEECLGWEAGVVYMGKSGEVSRSNGIVPPECKLIGGWGRVYRKGWKEPMEIEVNLDELIGRKKGGEVNSTWAKMPKIMIRKCAVVAVLREAFSEAFGQMYIQEEMNVDVPDINIPDEVVRENTSERDVTPPKDLSGLNKDEKEQIYFAGKVAQNAKAKPKGDPQIPGKYKWIKPGVMVDYCKFIGRPPTEFSVEVASDPSRADSGEWVVFLHGVSGYVLCDAVSKAKPKKDQAQPAEKSPDDRSWEANITAKLEELKGKPMGGMQKVWEDVLKKIGTMDRETAKLRVRKLYVLQDVVPGPDTDVYIKAISAAADADEILRLSIDFLNSGPGVATAMEADEKISALTKKILKFSETKNKGEKETIITQVDEIGKGENRKTVLTSLGKYARQLGAVGGEDGEIY
jgi:phage recombination protein Bet